MKQPVALVCSEVQIFEHLVDRKLKQHLSNKQLLRNSNHVLKTIPFSAGMRWCSSTGADAAAAKVTETAVDGAPKKP